MNEDDELLQRRNRTHAIVEGALLADIAIVFLLMRVYLPVPIVRNLIRALASVPFVMLTQRRGVKVGILAAISSYVLFSALVGPLLALTSLDVAVAGILFGIGRRAGLGAGINTLWTGVVYAVLDIALPTIASLFIFRYPIGKLIQSAHHFVQLMFRALLWVLGRMHAPGSVVHQVHAWEGPAVEHWQFIWLGITILYGLLNMYLVALVSTTVLRQLPENTLAPQSVTA